MHKEGYQTLSGLSSIEAQVGQSLYPDNWKSAKEKHLERQVGGEHYKQFKIQPIEFCHTNKIGYLESTAIKYLCRWRDKGGIEDLDKAIHYIQVLKELESANT